MKTKTQQFEDYKTNGGHLDFDAWESSFQYDPSLEFTAEQISDWVTNNEGDRECYPTDQEWKEIIKKNDNHVKDFNTTYKLERREVMTRTILLLLADMSREKIDLLLELGTPEELVDWCKAIYDREFDLNVEAIGVAGADEIAWQEALGVFMNEEE